MALRTKKFEIMKNKNIPLEKLLSDLSNSRFFTPIRLEGGIYCYRVASTNKDVLIPIKESYSREFLIELFSNSKAIDIPLHLLWFYLEVL